MSYVNIGQISFSKMEMTNSIELWQTTLRKLLKIIDIEDTIIMLPCWYHVFRNQSIDCVKGNSILNKEVLLFGVILNKMLTEYCQKFS